MDSKFNPPVSNSEFKRRAESITPQAAESLIHALRSRREAAVKHIDAEIKFYKKVIDYKKTGDANWIGEGTTA